MITETGLFGYSWGALISAGYIILEWSIRIVMLLVVPRRRAPAAAQAWLLLIFILPWLGLLLYALIGSSKLTERRRQLQRKVNDSLSDLAKQRATDPQFQALFATNLSPEEQQIAQLAQRVGDLPVFTGNDADLLPNYAGAISQIVADIDAATSEIHLLYYIFAIDGVGNTVLDALKRAAKRGVTCRVLIDAVGSHKDARKLLHEFHEVGIAAYTALPLRLFARQHTRPDLRNHRKIVIIDQKIGYMGSQNIVDAEYKPGVVYEEMVVRVTGPVVLQLQVVFHADWRSETGEDLFAAAQADTRPIPPATGPVAAQVLPSGPAYDTNNNLLVFNELLYAAQQRAVITTPYFVPDESLLAAIKSAALRGVETHLVVSTVADQFMVSRAQRSYYEELLAAGVRIHTINKPTLLHAKHISIDDYLCVVGSSNMDMRSFELDLEVVLVLYNREVTRALQKVEEGYFARSKELSLDAWRARPFAHKFVENTLRLLSPLL